MLKKSVIIALFGALVLSTAALADVKGDYESAIQNVKDNKIEESVKLFQGISNSTDKVYVTKANYQLGTYYLSKNDTEMAKSYFTKAIKDKKDSSSEVLESLAYLSNIYYTEKKLDLAEKAVVDMVTRTQGKDAKALSYVASFYLSGNVDYVKAEDYYKKAIAIEPQNLKYKADLIQLYEKKNDQAAITKTISEMKTVNNQLTNRDLGVYFAQYGNVDLANKYLLKAVNEDKNNDAILNLGIFYYNIGKKDEAKKLIAQAQSLGVKGADETMQQIKTAEAATPAPASK